MTIDRWSLGRSINAHWRSVEAAKRGEKLYTGAKRPAPPSQHCPGCGRSHWRPDGAARCGSCEVGRKMPSIASQKGAHLPRREPGAPDHVDQLLEDLL